MQLLDPREQVAPRALLGVVRGALVRVLAVRQVGDLLERGHERLREGLALAEPAGDRRLVGGGRGEGLGGELAARLERQLAVLAQLVEHEPVPVGPRHRRTCAKFFAAARSIDGPPMSIISTASSSVDAEAAATFANG